LIERPRCPSTALDQLGGAYLGGTVYDLATVGTPFERYNARSHQLSVVPVVQPATGSYGLALGGRF